MKMRRPGLPRLRGCPRMGRKSRYPSKKYSISGEYWVLPFPAKEEALQSQSPCLLTPGRVHGKGIKEGFPAKMENQGRLVFWSASLPAYATHQPLYWVPTRPGLKVIWERKSRPERERKKKRNGKGWPQHFSITRKCVFHRSNGNL